MTSDAEVSKENSKWQKVLEQEWQEIRLGRKDWPEAKDQVNLDKPGQPDNLVGLSFSGGGIRSATFNLGVIQALAELRLLRKIDYLSTVSGGGYIGSWLTSWMASHDQDSPDDQPEIKSSLKIPARLKVIGNFFSKAWATHNATGDTSKNIVAIEKLLAPEDENKKPTLAAGDSEPYALRHLRSYTDYLKPHGGLFSLDAMTAFMTWLRNTLLNQIILLTIFIALLMFPLEMGWFSWREIYESKFTENNLSWLMAAIFFSIAIGFINANIMFNPSSTADELPWYVRKNTVLFAIVMPLVIASFLLSIMLPSLLRLVDSYGGISEFMKTLTRLPAWPINPAAMLWEVFALCGLAFLISSPLIANPIKYLAYKEANWRGSSQWKYVLGFIVATLFGVLLLAVIAGLLASTSVTAWPNAAIIAKILTFGPPLILAAFALAIFVYVGLLGRVFDEHQREWWSRLIAMLAFVAVGWLVFFGISIWGPFIVEYLEIGLPHAIAWLSASGIGAALGKNASSQNGQKGSSKLLAAAIRITPYIFILGLCLLVSYLLNVSLMYFINDVEHFDPYYTRLEQLDKILSNPSQSFNQIILALVAIGIFLSWRVNINIFSFHNFYRNRLTRAYLAAGFPERMREKGKLPLTGMNDMDSPRLDRLPARPYHLLNTALNITNGKHLSWQERKAASFFFSKKYCGYFLPGWGNENNYCRTEDYLDRKSTLSLSLPMTISGAAASPNGGYHTSPPLAFLMTVFNVRLGWWMQNTDAESHWLAGGPTFGASYLIRELGASVDETSPFVYLSDGGHFENLGIYELVRRKCRLIIACDAGADPNYEFEDLGNAIRKCYIDLGAKIEIDTSEIKPKPFGPHKGRSLKHCAIGKIHYLDNSETGILIYIKASMGYSEATDIEHYKAAHPDFPHDPTANQFFTESQFESYRKLGYTLCNRAIDEAKKCAEAPESFLAKFCRDQSHNT